ncbi:MAG: hypothetical protein ACK4SY_08660 [Pyrobaculum sp.]
MHGEEVVVGLISVNLPSIELVRAVRLVFMLVASLALVGLYGLTTAGRTGICYMPLS